MMNRWDLMKTKKFTIIIFNTIKECFHSCSNFRKPAKPWSNHSYNVNDLICQNLTDYAFEAPLQCRLDMFTLVELCKIFSVDLLHE